MPPRREPTPQPPGPARGLRLQRFMADAGVASRRECETMIESGMVEVNGTTVTRLPVFIDPSRDRIVVDGRPVRGPKASAEGTSRVYIMLNKPDRVLCTTRDEAAETDKDGGRRTVIDLVQDRSGARLYPVGRLDYHSTGLVLLTNDGALADRMTHARYGVTRTYRVTIKGHVRPDMLDDLRRRVGKGDPAEPASTAESTDTPTSTGGVRVAREPGEETSTTILEVTLREGKSRQLSAILEQMGCVVRKLIRVGIGPLRLTGIAIGDWRNLTKDEVAALKYAGGLRAQPPAAPKPKRRPARVPRGVENGRVRRRKSGNNRNGPGGRR